MSAQEKSMAGLEKQGFKFANWICDRSSETDTNPDTQLAAIMEKRSKHGTEYREVEPDGTIN